MSNGKLYYSERIKLIEKTAIETDPYLYSYIIKGVTEEKSYTYLKTKLDIPCGKIELEYKAKKFLNK